MDGFEVDSLIKKIQEHQDSVITAGIALHDMELARRLNDIEKHKEEITQRMTQRVSKGATVYCLDGKAIVKISPIESKGSKFWYDFTIYHEGVEYKNSFPESISEEVGL